MQQSNAPSKLLLPFANSGGKNAIPVASQITVTPGAASYVDGFPPLTRTPIAAGGVPPSGLDMNGVLYSMSSILRWLNAGGGFTYDAAFAADSNVGGYPKGARLQRADGQGYWLNTADNNTTDPESAGAAAAGWVPDLTNGVAAVTMTNANVTLTPAQYGKPIIVITGTLTANLNLIFPPIAGEWIVQNKTTGNFSVTCKTPAGAGAVLTANNDMQIVWGDGTDIIKFSPRMPNAARTYNLQGTMVLGGAGMQLSADAITMRNAAGQAFTEFGVAASNVDLSATGPAPNARDQASAFTPGSWVHIYRIYNPTSGATAWIASATGPQTGPAMPAGYTYWAYCTTVRWTASSVILQCWVRGRTVSTAPQVLVSNSGSLTETAINISGIAPPNALTYAISCDYVSVQPNGSGQAYANTVVRMIQGNDWAVIGRMAIVGGTAGGFSPIISGRSIEVPYMGSQLWYYMTLSYGSVPVTSLTLDRYTVANGDS